MCIGVYVVVKEVKRREAANRSKVKRKKNNKIKEKIKKREKPFTHVG